jgi:Uma2 family endonuclease
MDVVLDHDRDLVVQPDVMFISRERAAIMRDVVRGAPDLVVEVASRGSYLYDRDDKVRWYGEAGVRECWLVNPDRQLVTVISLPATDDATGVAFGWTDRLRSGVFPDLSLTVEELTA